MIPPITLLCALFTVTVAEQVWTLYEDPGASLRTYQPRYDISKLTGGLGISFQILLPNDDACITLDNGYLGVVKSYGPKPCSVSVSDATVNVGATGAWYMTSQLNATLNCCTDTQRSSCNASNAGSFMIQGSGSCRTGAWTQISYNPPWALKGGRTGFSSGYQSGPGVVLVGGKNASSGQPLTDTWVQCTTGSACVQDEWLKGGDIPAGCDPMDLSLFTLDYNVYLVCPDGVGGPLAVFGIDSYSLQWSAVALTLPPSPALPPARYQATTFAQLPWITLGSLESTTTTTGSIVGGGALVSHGSAAAVPPAQQFLVRGGCLLALTGGPNASTPNGNLLIHRSIDGLVWTNWSTPIPSRTKAAIASWAIPGVSGHGVVIAGGIGADGVYRGDAYGLSGQFCCATACDGGDCDICNNHGTCLLGMGNQDHTCRCDDGWTGDMCMDIAPTPTPSVTPTPSSAAQPNRGNSIIPGLPDTGGVAVVVVAGLVGAALFVAAAWRIRTVRTRSPGVPTPATVAAVRDFK